MVRKAQTISWQEIEKRHAALFTNRKGNVAKSLHLVLGACTPSTPSTISGSICTATGRTASRIALSASASRISARSFVGRRESRWSSRPSWTSVLRMVGHVSSIIHSIVQRSQQPQNDDRTFREREGHYPSRVLADKIYRSRKKLRY